MSKDYSFKDAIEMRDKAETEIAQFLNVTKTNLFSVKKISPKAQKRIGKKIRRELRRYASVVRFKDLYARRTILIREFYKKWKRKLTIRFTHERQGDVYIRRSLLRGAGQSSDNAIIAPEVLTQYKGELHLDPMTYLMVVDGDLVPVSKV